MWDAISLVRLLIETQIVWLAALIVSWGAWRLFRVAGCLGTHRQWINFARPLFVAALLLPLMMPLMPQRRLFAAPAEIWFGRTAPGASQALNISATSSVVMSGLRISALSFPPLPSASVVAALVAVGLGLFIFRKRRLSVLAGRLEHLPVVRRMGRVRVTVSVTAPAPWSIWLKGRAFVVLPELLLERPNDARIAVLHELQHHRQGDTRWAHLLTWLDPLFFWSPIYHLWLRHFSLLQEFSCDEVLCARTDVGEQVYGRCLMDVARLSPRVGERLPLGALGMAKSHAGTILKRRFEMFFRKNRLSDSLSRAFVGSILGVSILTVAALAWTAHASVADRRLDWEKAVEVARHAESSSQIPVTMNQLVLDRLNYFVGTPTGRRFVDGAKQRYKNYERMISDATTQAGLPGDLMVVAFGESGYRNVDNGTSAGIWQFRASTARLYGLVVDGKIDQRFDEGKETGAAMAMLGDLFQYYGDWRLAFRAYNEGQQRVDELITTHNTRDPWMLEELAPSPDNYLPTMTALLIVLKNPELVK